MRKRIGFFAFLCSLFFILAFWGLIRPKPVLGRLACIPPEAVDVIPAGYTLQTSQGTFCDVYYAEVVSWDPTCGVGGQNVNQTLYHCKCNLTFMGYSLGSDWKTLYAVNSANLWSENQCYANLAQSTTTRIIATDLPSCRQYCEVGTPAAWCDASCGTCGVRLNNGTCTNDWGNGTYHLGCCRMECLACNSCGYINHSGADTCSSNGQCTVTCPTNTPIPPTNTPTPRPPTPPTCSVSGNSGTCAYSVTWNAVSPDCGLAAIPYILNKTANGVGASINSTTTSKGPYADIARGQTINAQIRVRDLCGQFATGPVCTWTCPVASPTPTPNCNVASGTNSFTYSSNIAQWLQTTGGDVHAKGTISETIPACATSHYFSKDGTGGAPGFVTWEGVSVPDMGDEGGDTSSTNWNGKSYSPLSSQEYSYMLLRLGIPTSTDTFDGNLSALTDGVYYSPTTKNITGNIPAGKKIVIFMGGDANIKNDITILPSTNGFFALVVLGNINFDNTVANAQGLFLANGTIGNGTGTVAFAGQGSFVGLSGFALGRDLGTGPILNCTPAQTFVERPDFLINAPPAFKVSSGYFQEVAP